MKSLSKQIYVHSVDTSNFYRDGKEQDIHNLQLETYKLQSEINKLAEQRGLPKDKAEQLERIRRLINKRLKRLKETLKQELETSTGIRHLREDALKDTNKVGLFDSALSRTLKIGANETTEDILIVQSYYFKVLKDIILNGFMYKGELYTYFSSSAGQIRTKKSVFLKQSTWLKHQDSLTCGLSLDSINAKGGCNTNKYLAYLALTNSATNVWQRFNIDKTIVVPDMETDVEAEVDYIDTKNSFEITPMQMKIPIEHTDGCGMIIANRNNKKAFMCRLPWVKGLLVPFNFKADEFKNDEGKILVKDIYGKEHDIIKEDIQVIFTKSQFKMWKYYESWEEYKEKFKLHNCQAAKLNEEDDEEHIPDAKLNYQMLQTLEMTDEELLTLADDTITDIQNIGKDKDVMLRILGADATNPRKNPFQQALSLYPELLSDAHARQAIKDKKASVIKQAKAGKLNINGKYTFVSPDLYAYCEFLFKGEKHPKGLLKNGEVYCRLYDEGKLDLLRSPHLYIEHSIRQNVKDDEKAKWFCTNAVYTSIEDIISKILQFDNDGDKLLVVKDETLIKVAERAIKKYDIKPLYYEMAKADASIITNQQIYDSLILAYKANIGDISNRITKIFNSAEGINEKSLKIVKVLTCLNNFVIDYAKTLFMPTVPKPIQDKINAFNKSKAPHFFIYAKDKAEARVEPCNESAVNRLDSLIPNTPIRFKKIVGELDYHYLMKVKSRELDNEIVNTYVTLDRNKKWISNQEESQGTTQQKHWVFEFIRQELLKINNDPYYIVDTLVHYLYGEKDSSFKTTLWEAFGEELVNNIKKNTSGTKICADCNKRHTSKSNQILCKDCQTLRRRESNKASMRRKRTKVKKCV
ncbi:hypothetical protein ACU3L3_06900 [Priestia endophytica]